MKIKTLAIGAMLVAITLTAGILGVSSAAKAQMMGGYGGYGGDYGYMGGMMGRSGVGYGHMGGYGYGHMGDDDGYGAGYGHMRGYYDQNDRPRMRAPDYRRAYPGNRGQQDE